MKLRIGLSLSLAACCAAARLQSACRWRRRPNWCPRAPCAPRSTSATRSSPRAPPTAACAACRSSSRARTGVAPERGAGVRDLRIGRPRGRFGARAELGRRVPGDRSGARARHAADQPLRDHRRRVPGRGRFADPQQRPGRSRRRAHRGGQGQRVRPVPVAQPEAGADRLRADVAGGDRSVRRAKARRRRGRQAAAAGRRQAAAGVARARRPLHGDPAGDGHAASAATPARRTSTSSSRR